MKKWITIVLSVCVGTAALATEEVSYLAGELPPPAKIEKVLSAGNPADVLLLSSTPNKLLGLAGFNMEKRGKLFSAAQQALPTLGYFSTQRLLARAFLHPRCFVIAQ